MTLRFDDRVAIVTGAGRGLGRAYATLLAERGARVVVNDLGSSITGDGADRSLAEQVVADIVAAGGEAVADAHDVSTTKGSEALIAAASDSFGRIDILVNNAGIIRRAEFAEVDSHMLEQHWAIHVLGSFNTSKAAWPHFVDQQYGRVVHTTSTAIFGRSNNAAYASAKSGVIGLARSTRVAGEPHGIKVNVVAPNAITRMADPNALKDAAVISPLTNDIPSSAVAPLVALLAHESCPVNGEILAAGANRFARLFLASTRGYLHEGSEPPTVEDVAAHLPAICAEQDYYLPQDLGDWNKVFLSHVAAD
jgi:NAD(P)-dependent dehydrogenase (short-subunit alcohol dehydrogenase family)